MTDTRTLGPWLRRFLAEHLVSERNLARNTQRSYRDTLVLLLPSSAARGANRSTGWPSSISPPSVCCSSSHILKMRGAAPRRPAISGSRPSVRLPASSAAAVPSTSNGARRSVLCPVARLLRFPGYSQTRQKAKDRFAWAGFRFQEQREGHDRRTRPRCTRY